MVIGVSRCWQRNGRKNNINYLDMIYHDIEEKGVGTGQWLNIYDKIPFAISLLDLACWIYVWFNSMIQHVIAMLRTNQ